MADLQNLFDQLKEVLGAGPTSTGFSGLASQVAANEAAGLSGSVNPIDLNAEYALQAGPKNTIDLNEAYAAQTAAPAPLTSAIPLPIPPGAAQGKVPVSRDLGVLSVATPASIKHSSRARHQDTAATLPEPEPVSPASSPSATKDSIAELLAGRRQQLSDEKKAALDAAKSQETLTDDEKLATALLGVLPGLIGLIGGAAAGGGYGAAAGAAGGLQGGAQGIQSLVSNKSDKRKEALAQAEKAADRTARTDDMALSHAEELQKQGFSAEQAEKSRQFSASETDRKLSSDAKQSAANRALQRYIADQNNLADTKKAQISASTKAAGSKGVGADLYTNLDTAFTNLKELEGVVGKYGNYEGPLGDPRGREALGRLALDTAIAYAKIVDPDSVAREGEVQAAQKYLIPMGLGEQNATTLEAIKGMRRTLQQKAAARHEIGGLPQIPESVLQTVRTTPSAPTPSASNKQKYGF
jgi:hypothetical protein